MVDEVCESCGGTVTYCAHCHTRQFHLRTSEQFEGGVEMQLCAFCDGMALWPTVQSDPVLHAAVRRLALEGAARQGSV